MNFLRKAPQENMAVVNKAKSKNQEKVYQAVKELKYPSNGLAIAHYLKWDSASVTPRLAELVRKGRIKIAYRKHGLDKIIRNFYVVDESYDPNK